MKLPSYRRLLLLFSLPTVLATYFRDSTGEEYGLGFTAKLRLAWRMFRNNSRITSGSHFVEHLTMATSILNVPRTVGGCLVECGCWKGGSTANLSLVAALVGRDLEVFDSFAGIPEPSVADREHKLPHSGELHTYEQGGWAGSFDEVSANATRYGEIGRCNFHVGYFDSTLPDFDKPCVFVFADVDLRDSLETCVQHLWPLLADGSRLFTHEAEHMEIASLFFDREWWRGLESDPPGLVGAGTGLGLLPREGGFGSPLGYAVKALDKLSLRHVPQ